MLLYRNLRRPVEETEIQFLSRLRKHLTSLGYPPLWIKPYRRSIDARRGRSVSFVYHVAFQVEKEKELLSFLGPKVQLLTEAQLEIPDCGTEHLNGRIVVAGTGPAGLYASYLLARSGFNPLICEKGFALDQRIKAVKLFFKDRTFSDDGNMLFGEGGAGTFSDGKLITRINKPGIRNFYKLLVECGAPEDILVDAKPHIGTDRLRRVVSELHKKIVSAGGEFRFNCELSEFRVSDGCLKAVKLGSGWEEVSAVVIATGQHNDNIYRAISRAGGIIEPRPYQVGVRIEHHQEQVDKWRYGRSAGKVELPPASYQLSYRGSGSATGENNATTFCMCPGGEVVPVSAGKGRLSTNGMSRYQRDGVFANSALITTLESGCMGSNFEEILNFRRSIENKTFLAGGCDWKAPAQKAEDFLFDKQSSSLPESSYKLGLSSAKVNKLLPETVSASIAAALLFFDGLFPGFSRKDALIIGLETRVSSPLRILRNNSGEAENISGLYPCGEGSGYSSGITSSALDGARIALSIIGRYNP